ncbi:MAG: class I SAM-dependent DNA methyltransferase, partial [Flavobacteriales bacterium]|nr:class I SAM-dependent DNA methyltransferase [Flavobacteriales bacterium]
TLLIEHKSRGKDLDKALQQAVDYLHGVKDSELPRFVLVSDFARLRLRNMEERTEHEILLEELPDRTELFDFIAGYEQRPVREQDPVNIKAAELMGQLHDELRANGYEGHELKLYLVRLLFCLFADDTGIFEPNSMYDLVDLHTREDGTDLGNTIAQLFQVLNTPPEKRQKNLSEAYKGFSYVNGKLFAEHLPIAAWDSGMRVTLLECCSLDWAKVSPAIFGSMFQGVMDPKQRRDLGAHYTSEENILKLIRPLFLDELWEEYNKVKGNRRQLERFHHKLAELRFLDPACGCGNFLVITYRELRRLELEILRTLQQGQQVMDVDHLVLLNVDRFFGIELEEFPAQIAQVALWLVDHQMNQEISAAFGEYMVRIPLRSSATIAQGNALRVDWQGLLPEPPPDQDGRVMRYDYILGNPPFIGSKLMSKEMREDILQVFPGLKGAGTLDYVCGWYGLAAQYMKAHGGKYTRTAFVSTNSITQGEQVGVLWGPLLEQGFKIHFAHRTFRWNNEARGVAAVHCVIVGFGDFEVPVKRLFSYDDPKGPAHEEKAKNINPYLVDGRDVVISSRSKPLCAVPEISFGNMPLDGGNLILSNDEKIALVKEDPDSAPYIRPLISARELMNGIPRWCLWLVHAEPVDLKRHPRIIERIEGVRAFRAASRAPSTRKFAATPTLFRDRNNPRTATALPRHFSESREYLVMGYFDDTSIISDSCMSLANPSLYHFGVLSSAMHMAWIRSTCGRIKSDYRYSKDIVYNNYPWPEAPTDAQPQAVEEAAQGVLDARAQFPGSSLADLYDPLTMPPALLKAHQSLDRAVDRCYRPQPFTSDAKRVEFLFELYEKYVAGLLAEDMPKRRR